MRSGLYRGATRSLRAASGACREESGPKKDCGLLRFASFCFVIYRRPTEPSEEEVAATLVGEVNPSIIRFLPHFPGTCPSVFRIRRVRMLSVKPGFVSTWCVRLSF